MDDGEKPKVDENVTGSQDAPKTTEQPDQPATPTEPAKKDPAVANPAPGPVYTVGPGGVVVGEGDYRQDPKVRDEGVKSKEQFDDSKTGI